MHVYVCILLDRFQKNSLNLQALKTWWIILVFQHCTHNFFALKKLLWNRKWSLSLVPAKPTKWLLYDEFMKNLMLWEERRVFTVSELSEMEQGAKVWFLFGSQGTWHTKCFYKERKRQICFWVQWNIMISMCLFCSNCLFRQLPISRKSLELIRVTYLLPTEYAIQRECWACPPCPWHQTGVWSRQTGPATCDVGICEIFRKLHLFLGWQL